MFIILLGLLIGASASDILHFRVSDKYWVSIWLLSLLPFFTQENKHLLEYAVGFLIISVPLCALTICIQGGFGGADVKMMAVCGALLGARLIVAAFIWGLFIAGGVCMAGRIVGRRWEYIPLVPFFSLGIAVSLFLSYNQ